MNVSNYSFVTAAEANDMYQRCEPLMLASWSLFMMNDPVGNRLWVKLYDVFPEYQFMLVDRRTDEIVAAGNSLPFHFDRPLTELPDTGWDWVIEKGFTDQRSGRSPNLLSALAITIAPEHRGKGLSSHMVTFMRELGRSHRLSSLVAPVRPNLKTAYPITPIEQYVEWKDDHGLPFDPWLRVHVRLGGEILSICRHAMRVPGTVAQWEHWAGMKFPESGSYTVPGALTPVTVDRDRDLAEYIEPNVWTVHPIDRTE
jgi:GNAT superfamily N-acetyltransferase